MSTTKGRNLGLRLDETDTKELEDFERVSGIEATTLARNALRACLAYWKEHRKISFPLRLVEVASHSATAFDSTKPEAPDNSEQKEEKESTKSHPDSSTVQRVRGRIAAARPTL